jgi:hypothetical protein
MNEEKLQMFRNRLLKMWRHTGKLARRQGITCYRVYDHDLPEFPFCIELYEDKLYLAEYQRRHGMSDEEHAAWLESCIPTISEVLETPDEQIFYRERRRKAGRLDQYEKLASEQEFFIAKESGLSFRINLTDYLDTGLFLDHRTTPGNGATGSGWKTRVEFVLLYGFFLSVCGGGWCGAGGFGGLIEDIFELGGGEYGVEWAGGCRGPALYPCRCQTMAGRAAASGV